MTSLPRDYYNDHDPQVCAWLRELIRCGHLPPGDVDERSILDVRPADLAGYRRVHFFAGIGGWAYALQLAGWPEDEPVWTGSPPCQPFSAAGKRLGRNDARHLAPYFLDLVRACRPPVLFGEQVASAEVFGGAAKPSRRNAASAPQWAWLDDLCDRLEAAHYAVGASGIPAAGVGAPHIRQRTFFGAVRLADADDARPQGRVSRWPDQSGHDGRGGATGGLADANGRDASAEREQRGGQHGQQPQDGGSLHDGRPDATNGFWRSADWLHCRDGKWRPVKSSVLGVADGLPPGMVRGGAVVPAAFPLAQKQERRVMRLRGYGNAIVPQVAAEFVVAFVEARGAELKLSGRGA